MGTDKVPQIKQGHVVFVGSKGSGKTSLYQCLKSPNPQVIDGPGCSLLVEDWRPFSNESPGKSHTDRLSSQLPVKKSPTKCFDLLIHQQTIMSTNESTDKSPNQLFN